MGALTFSQALALAEAQARSSLDVALHERLSCAVSLVRDGRVFQTSTGAWEVDSASREELVYNVNGACPCADVHYNHPPEGLCKHRIAVYLARRVQQLLHQPVVPEVLQKTENLPVSEAVQKTDTFPAPLPEAPASVNVRVTIGGRECQLTLRDSDEARLLERLAAVLERFPVEPKPASPQQPQAPLSPQQQGAAAMHRPVSGFCAVHNAQMKENHKDGRTWYSHYDEAAGRWCKGKGR